MDDMDAVFRKLAASDFRRRFRLDAKDRAYLQSRGLEAVSAHGRDFIDQRLAPALPRNDGKQTPWRGHPIFVAQHATATCCRGCLAKWHGVPKGRELSADERDYVAEVLARWLKDQLRND